MYAAYEEAICGDMQITRLRYIFILSLRNRGIRQQEFLMF